MVAGRCIAAPWRRWTLIRAAEQTIHGEDGERSGGFSDLDCTRADSIEIFGQRFRIRNGERSRGTGISSGSVAKR